ncbi:TPA: NACHT domain-containing protein, partial [Enterococcus faecium]
NGIKQYNLSLKRQSIDELLDICGGLYKYEINTKNGKKISFGVIWYLLYKNKGKLNLDFDNLLFPTKLEKPIGNGNWVWNYYNDQQIINWIKNYYKYGQESYRKIVEELFPNLRNDLALYQVGPVQYSIKVKLPDRASNDNFSQGSIGTSFCLVDSVKNCNPKMSVVENDTRLIDLDDYHNQLRKEAKFYNRTLSIGGTS